ncbi:hypothetical protein J6590_030774 [Homalodisca vitripennis]|nr:hypothetical protein J6590_030774 [Homalodisca vitripennis]
MPARSVLPASTVLTWLVAARGSAVSPHCVYLQYTSFKQGKSWVKVASLGLVLSLLSLLMMPLLPESFQWLLTQGRSDEADQALLRLQRASTQLVTFTE